MVVVVTHSSPSNEVNMLSPFSLKKAGCMMISMTRLFFLIAGISSDLKSIDVGVLTFVGRVNLSTVCSVVTVQK